jgi:RNA polymerase sigma factor (sigma-70 family)
MMPSAHLHQLLVAAQAGDPDAMESLLVVTQPDLRRYALRQCAASSSTDDIVQEAMILVTRHLGALRSLAAYAGWLQRIVYRLCMLPVLQRLGQLPLEDDFPAAFRPDPELRAELTRAIESLPGRYREALLLRDFEELTIAEMAVRLGISIEATKSRLHRARSLVREYLDPARTTAR